MCLSPLKATTTREHSANPVHTERLRTIHHTADFVMMSMQEYISSHHDGPTPEAYRYEYQTPSATTYVINPMKAGSARISNASEASSANRNIALFPTRTMSVFGPEQEPSRNFSQVRVTDAMEFPATYGVTLQRQGSAVSSQKSRDGGQGEQPEQLQIMRNTNTKFC